MKSWKAEMYLFLITMIWGGTFIFTKLGLDFTTPSLYVSIRFFIALLLSLIIFGKHLRNANFITLKNGFVLGLFFGCGFVLQTWGLDLTTVTKSAFITGMAIVLTPFVFKIFVRRKVLFWSKIGVLIATMGLWIFTNPEIDNLNLGDILTLASTIFWALYIVFMDIYTKDKDDFSETIQLVISQFAGTFLVGFLAHLLLEEAAFKVEWTSTFLISIAYNALLASFVLTLIHTTFQRYTTPVKAVLIFSLEPVFAAILAVLVINEIMNGRETLGAIILFLGVLSSELGGMLTKWFKSKRMN